MELLYWLQSIRTPLGDAFFSLITHLGEETLFIVFGLLVFWCLDKWEGYYLLSTGLTGTVVNQGLKLWFRVPRPWVRDPDFPIVEAARAEATGYSFPSGHTQSAVGIFGALARWNKQRWLRILCVALCLLVPFSRMYLGVHTPADVGVSFLLALVMVFGFYPVIRKAMRSPNTMRLLLLCMVAASVGLLLFVTLYPFPADVDADNLAHAVENAWKLTGAIGGMLIAWWVDWKFIRFETKAVWWAQLIKIVLGLAVVVGIKAGLKAPLIALIGNAGIANAVRYGLMVVFAGVVWPLTFKFWGKCGKK